ncbi:MAG: XylR family transcriptional regulator [Sedimentisphaeraceae bacterium JB056]
MDGNPKVILSIESSRSLGRDLLRGIARYARVNGPWRFYSEPGGKEAIPNLSNWKADGIIANIINTVSAERIKKLGIPSVTKEMKLKGRPRISANGELIGQMAAKHFLEKGFKNFAYYCLIDAEWTKRRGDAFGDYVAEKGCKMDFFPVKGTRKKSWQHRQQLLSQWLSELEKPLGVLAGNDEQGRHVIEACRMAGLRVPDDVAVLGVDNDDIVCDLCEPQLSSIALDSESAGFRAAQVLDNLMKSGHLTSDEEIVIQPTYIVQRHSTDILAVEDDTVAEAMRFIRDCSRRNITVEDVAEASAVSRRVLEKRFRRVLNSSVLKEIRAARTRNIIMMLMETDMSISQIAESMDFPGIDHFARYFKQEAGISPMAYRKQHKYK